MENAVERPRERATRAREYPSSAPHQANRQEIVSSRFFFSRIPNVCVQRSPVPRRNQLLNLSNGGLNPELEPFLAIRDARAGGIA